MTKNTSTGTTPAAIPMPPVFLMRPRECARSIKDGLSERGFRLEIGWKWQGWDRAGVVYVFNRERECIYEDSYPRGNSMWRKNDPDVFSCNNGSSKHHALLAAKEFVYSQPT